MNTLLPTDPLEQRIRENIERIERQCALARAQSQAANLNNMINSGLYGGGTQAAPNVAMPGLHPKLIKEGKPLPAEPVDPEEIKRQIYSQLQQYAQQAAQAGFGQVIDHKAVQQMAAAQMGQGAAGVISPFIRG